jgi:predicted acylesterase/phospholipase RssA
MSDAHPPLKRPKKRAIALGGGGPAAGFHMGVLSALEKYEVSFDVWSLSCIGAWVGAYYNQLKDGDRASQTYEFFKQHAFRDTASYQGFPVNKAFAPNLEAHASAWMAHALDPQTYLDAFNTNDLPDAAAGWTEFLLKPERWQRSGDRNAHVLNNILAVHPVSRFMTSLLYLSKVNGLSNIYYKDSSFLDDVRLDKLDPYQIGGLGEMSREELAAVAARHDRQQAAKVPEIYHNAWRLADAGPNGDKRVTGHLQLFNNKWLDYRAPSTTERRKRDYLPISRASLCACSALPYVEQTVKIPNDNDNEYSEGALIDTVSFLNLVEDHHDLDEIWVCRIVDYRQIRLQKNLHDSLGNLCQQFAAEVGENDIDLFKSHLRKSTGRTPRIVEIPLHLETMINFRWDHANLDIAFGEGVDAIEKLMAANPDLRQHDTNAPTWDEL